MNYKYFLELVDDLHQILSDGDILTNIEFSDEFIVVNSVTSYTSESYNEFSFKFPSSYLDDVIERNDLIIRICDYVEMERIKIKL